MQAIGTSRDTRCAALVEARARSARGMVAVVGTQAAEAAHTFMPSTDDFEWQPKQHIHSCLPLMLWTLEWMCW